MRAFLCHKCGQQLSFENSLCLNCMSSLGFHLPSRDMLVLDSSEMGEADGVAVGRCADAATAGCNWLIEIGAGLPALCESCQLTRTRPADDDTAAMKEFAEAELAKRRLILELRELGLPIVDRLSDPVNGLAFDLLSSSHERVTTGHADGVITLDLAEGDDVHREQLRVEMDEPYRTLLGHFRHEIGHYYQMVLVGDGPNRAEYESLFGDPDLDYQQALDRHYSQGTPPGWRDDYVSSYATMHPMEDFAETFAHYLHIRDTLDTAAAYGLAPSGATLQSSLKGDVGFQKIVELWLPLTWALNQINRAMGRDDLYPFVLPPKVLDKLRFVNRITDSYDPKSAR